MLHPILEMSTKCPYIITNLNHCVDHGHHLVRHGGNMVDTIMRTTEQRTANQVKSIGWGEGEVHRGAIGVAHYGNQECLFI